MNDAGNNVTGGQCFDDKPFGPACEAYRNLLGNQRQLDMDGVEVGVSRQALDQVLSAYTHLTRRHDELIAANNVYRDRAIKAEAEPTEEALARTIYVAIGYEENDPWERAIARRERLGMTRHTGLQLSCLGAAAAILVQLRAAR
jgi:hypothetical protein